MIRALALVLALAGLPAAAQDLVADLSQTRVAITTGFEGSELLVFGAIRAGEAAGPFDVIVTISGPLRPVTVRKKSRVAGIWANTEAVEIDAAPTLYKVATTGPIDEVLTQTDDLRHRITMGQAIRSVGAPEEIEDAQRFTEALIRIRRAAGLYRMQEGAVALRDDTLFRTSIALPANLVEGAYDARIYLTHERQVVASYARTLDVQKVGLERWIYTLAHNRPLAYGLLSIAIAIAAGWLASAVFRYLRG